MGRWTKVRWTEAGQITELLGWKTAEASEARSAPDDFFTRLRTAGRLQDAAYFLGQSLPRYEVVVWATDVVRELADGEDRASPALAAALEWVADPSETRRRAAYQAAADAEPESPGRIAALAAFFSGGSISPEGQAAVPAPRTSAGRLGAAAVVLAAIKSPDMTSALGWALDQGEKIAIEGAPKA
ncbi:MAG TPA: hypothetical protein VF459_13960 [Caulobacteraceae bacterium]